ncbi:uncharacterized protein LOC131941427 [Physella acuta]|uniref:uncharacterized protein LOC131941427 n=1 Tax=Physella acuta TaxID=109671 RepID=UPI0027DEA19A|nr:uncharacterized protein LOC131941427 [Physella acuta]
MACQEDDSQHFKGTHEVQECLEGEAEADLHTHFADCTKNPGHAGFIPVNKFTVGHFPSGYHDNDLYELTKAVADITVSIAVKFTSPDRPEFVPGTQDPYPCYSSRGKKLLRTGTGRVFALTKYTEGMDRADGDYRTCPCPECVKSATPSKVWWEIFVQTARHVVFDESEARQSSCRLWFDDDQSPVVKMCGLGMDVSVTEGDMCDVYYATHDVQVGDRLQEMGKRYSQLGGKVIQKYRDGRDVDKLTIIVSHPHGCSKQVSVGHWVHREVLGDDGNYKFTKYRYTNSTCPGSSGALVYIVGCWSVHPHSGSKPDGINYSGVMLE